MSAGGIVTSSHRAPSLTLVSVTIKWLQ